MCVKQRAANHEEQQQQSQPPPSVLTSSGIKSTSERIPNKRNYSLFHRPSSYLRLVGVLLMAYTCMKRWKALLELEPTGYSSSSTHIVISSSYSTSVRSGSDDDDDDSSSRSRSIRMANHSSEGVVDNGDDNSPRLDWDANFHPTLKYGIELSFLFPEEVTIDVRRDALEVISIMLHDVGISTIIADKSHADIPENTWKLVLERRGFEIASPLSPSLNEVAILINTLRDFGCIVHPILNMMHINVDARNRTLTEVRNVYKNALTAENAFDHLYMPENMTAGGKAFTMRYFLNASNVMNHAYRVLDRSDSYQHLIHLGIGESHRDMELNARKLYYRYTLAMLKETSGQYVYPKSFEFRGLRSSLDPIVPISWLKFAVQFVEQSYAGNVLPTVYTDPKEAWLALFRNIVRDSALEASFRDIEEHYNPILNDDEIRTLDTILCKNGHENACAALARGTWIKSNKAPQGIIQKKKKKMKRKKPSELFIQMTKRFPRMTNVRNAVKQNLVRRLGEMKM